MVDRAAGRRDDDVDAASQAAQLLADRLAAVDRQDPGAELAAVVVDRLGDLHRQLAGGDQDERRRAAARRPSPMGMRWSIGSANAAVLPVPVGASARRSRPASSGGIASRWIGVGSS